MVLGECAWERRRIVRSGNNPVADDSEYLVAQALGLELVGKSTIVVTPYRFANKRGFWSYCGLAIVMWSSSDWVRTRTGDWIKAPVQLELQVQQLHRGTRRLRQTSHPLRATGGAVHRGP